MINIQINITRLRITTGSQLAIYKRSEEVELGATENNISQQSERDLNQGPTDFKSLGHAAFMRLDYDKKYSEKQ